MRRLRSAGETAWVIFSNRYLSFVFRIAMGATFIVSGAGKLPERAEFVKQCAEYNLLPDVLVSIYGNALPWVEVVVGVLLVVGLVSRVAAGVGVLTAVSCIIANSVILYRGLNMECGCFGEVAVLQTRDALIIDFALLIMGLQVLLRRGDLFSLDSLIRRRQVSGDSA